MKHNNRLITFITLGPVHELSHKADGKIKLQQKYRSSSLPK